MAPHGRKVTKQALGGVPKTGASHRRSSSTCSQPLPARSVALYPPRLWRLTPIPSTPVPYLPVPEASLALARMLLASLPSLPRSPTPSPSRRCTPTSRSSPTKTLPPPYARVTRSMTARSSLVAAAYIQAVLEGTGAVCAQRVSYDGFAPNSVCRYAATRNTTATVLHSALDDSLGSFGSLRAPGSEDDGSGTMAVPAIARTIAAGSYFAQMSSWCCARARSRAWSVPRRMRARFGSRMPISRS